MEPAAAWLAPPLPLPATPADAAALFYTLAAAMMFTVWALFSVSVRGDFHWRATRAAVATRPSWVPPRLLAALHRHPALYAAVCHLAPLAMALAALDPSSQTRRLTAAVCVSAYALAESSVTNSHRDYANVYCAWALALLPLPSSGDSGDAGAAGTWGVTAEGLALGVCVHFIASSGFAKVTIGGAVSWSRPGTLRGVLRHYDGLSVMQGGPGSHTLNQIVAGSDTLSSSLAAFTLLFECLLVPASLALPSSTRWTLASMSVCLHIGIAATQSLGIGIAFLPNIAAYAFGFGSPRVHPPTIAGITAALSSTARSDSLTMASHGPWLAAVLIVAVPALRLAVLGASRGLLPENWPVSPFALFAWSSRQWDALFDRLAGVGPMLDVPSAACRRAADARTRLVVTTSGVSAAMLVGRRIRPKYGSDNEWGSAATVGEPSRGGDDDTSPAVHDAWELVVGETVVHQATLGALLHLCECPSEDWRTLGQPGRRAAPALVAAETLACDVGAWLRRDGRLVEINSGDTLRNAFVVTVKGSDGGVVVESVVAASEATGEAKHVGGRGRGVGSGDTGHGHGQGPANNRNSDSGGEWELVKGDVGAQRQRRGASPAPRRRHR